MAIRPIIGVTTQTLDAIPGVIPRAWAVGQRYALALAGAGGIPQPIPLLASDPDTLRHVYDGLDGILFTGGADIDPSAYDAERSPLCGRSDPDRDRTELTLARWAMDERKPALGICRGLQLINVAAGGTLHQDLAAERPESIRHDYPDFDGANPHDQLVHDVELLPGSRAGGILAESCVRVNSTHHQGIARLADTLTAWAHAPDGVVEGIESKDDSFVLGVQWHPEDLTDNDPRMRRIFDALVHAATAWRTRQG